ncbi:TetR/AcrR family transcriptional regulator [Mycobacterium botniense]|uniref:TetR/AcrR family transcriptional regulator n=1 Tax=Mycobacterium botniense TaxID=84962 RepID=UPI00157FDC78|nr:TetR/AcrR family transcriptional regulator [Mycobacterium botniense]
MAKRGPGRPPAAKAADTRKRIVRAAREVFTERGYDAATFQEIALRADLTRPAINHYFPSKRLLYREVVDQTNALVVTAGIERARRETRLMSQLSAYMTTVIHGDFGDPAVVAFLITTVIESQRHPEFRRLENGSIRATRLFLTQAINEAKERGEITLETDVSTVAEMLLALIYGVSLYAGFIGSVGEAETVTERLLQLMSGTLWRLES